MESASLKTFGMLIAIPASVQRKEIYIVQDDNVCTKENGLLVSFILVLFMLEIGWGRCWYFSGNNHISSSIFTPTDNLHGTFFFLLL